MLSFVPIYDFAIQWKNNNNGFVKNVTIEGSINTKGMNNKCLINL